MPWKGEKNPYKIWLSEIILQQTRVDQGIQYYRNFIEAFPDIQTLANASEQKIYKLWEGLGYYSRCRNLIETAKHVAMNLEGTFPGDYESIRKLRGVGPYTAAAISSFAFNEPRAVVDGNVFRVLSRIFNIDTAIDTPQGKKFFSALADDLLDHEQPGIYNQAIMDFGAVICRPVPRCTECPFNKNCKALLQNKISSLPVKQKKIIVRKRWFNYFLVECKGRYAIRQRVEKDIWRHLHEFLLVESSRILTRKKIHGELAKKNHLEKNSFEVKSVSPVFRQRLSHQLIEGRISFLKCRKKPELPGMFWVKKEELNQYAFPKFIKQYLSDVSAVAKDSL